MQEHSPERRATAQPGASASLDRLAGTHLHSPAEMTTRSFATLQRMIRLCNQVSIIGLRSSAPSHCWQAQVTLHKSSMHCSTTEDSVFDQVPRDAQASTMLRRCATMSSLGALASSRGMTSVLNSAECECDQRGLPRTHQEVVGSGAGAFPIRLAHAQGCIGRGGDIRLFKSWTLVRLRGSEG